MKTLRCQSNECAQPGCNTPQCNHPGSKQEPCIVKAAFSPNTLLLPRLLPSPCQMFSPALKVFFKPDSFKHDFQPHVDSLKVLSFRVLSTQILTLTVAWKPLKLRVSSHLLNLPC